MLKMLLTPNQPNPLPTVTAAVIVTVEAVLVLISYA